MTSPDLPLLEDDLDSAGLISAHQVVQRDVDMPATAVLCWFHEVVAAVGDREGARRVTDLLSEAGRSTVWELQRGDQRIAVVNPGVGAPVAAMVLEEIVALGARRVVACGGAGALLPDLVLGHAVVVDSAVRDEGTSLHYLPPSRTVDADPEVVTTLVATLADAGVAHLVGRTWTTDALFRETRARTDRRVAEGCVTVEMETSALIAVARRLGVPFGQVLMSGDSLAGDDWDHRSWTTASDARTALFDLALDAAARLADDARPPVRSALRAAITAAMKRRDRAALAVYRSALAAVDNAEAVPVGDSPAAGAVEASTVGVGRAEADRRELTEAQQVAVVRAEAAERRAAADTLAARDTETAARLRREARLLDTLVDG